MAGGYKYWKKTKYSKEIDEDWGQSLDDKDGVDWFNYMQMRAPDDDELERCFWHSYGYYVEVLDDYFIVNTEDEEDDTDGEPLPYSDEAIYWYGESPPFFDEESLLFEDVHPFSDEGDEQCNIMNTKIPWQKIVEHHKEMTRRAEEAFFSLLITNQPSDRWSSIDHFSPEHLHGPWKIADSSLTSLPLKRSIFNEENRELYLGGPVLWPGKRIKMASQHFGSLFFIVQ